VADYSWDPGERGRLAALGVLLIGALLYPLRQYLRPAKERRDGFPLSYFPMFSKLRKQTVKIVYAVGVDADGGRHYVPFEIFGLNSRSFNQVRRQLTSAVKRGRAMEYAADLARRFAAAPAHTNIVRVDVLRGTFDLDACLLDGHVRSSADVELASVSVAEATAAATTDPELLPISPASEGSS
jgi:hypothetical protein